MLGALLAILPSGIAMIVLAWRDPKRLRNLGRPASRRPTSLGPVVRRGLIILTLLPGMALAAGGLWIPFLIWLGGSCTFGWLVTQGFGRT